MEVKTQNSKTYPLETLASEWFWTQAEPSRDNSASSQIRYLFGTKGLSKMLQFKKKVGLNNDHIDYWINLDLAQQEGEPRIAWKIRQAFRKALLKYRGETYIFQSSKKDIACKLLNE